jgi:hypothetical protein
MQMHSIYEILSMTRAGSTMCTVHYRIKIAMPLRYNKQLYLRDRNKYDLHVERNHNAIKYVTKLAQTSTHLKYITPYSSTETTFGNRK